MTSLYVDGRTASLIERSTAIIEAKMNGDAPLTKTRRVPVWLPDGEEVKSVAQAAVMMGLPVDVTAHYVLEQKDVSEDLAVDATAFLQRKAMLEDVKTKVVRSTLKTQ